MSARQNYGFERRRKDQMRRAKQEEKRQRKTDREAAGETGPDRHLPYVWKSRQPGPDSERRRRLASPR